MLRVFKVQSPMSVGAWTLAAFGGSHAAALCQRRLNSASAIISHSRRSATPASSCRLLSGLPLHNYTGVLIGATAIPVWNENIATLPIHFGMSGVQAGASLLELMGHGDNRALNLLVIGSALWESWEGFHLESRNEQSLRPLKRGASGWITRTGGVMSGPLPLLCV